MRQTRAEIRLPDWLAARAPPAAPASDEACIRFTIELARENAARGGGPFGACVRSEDGGVIASAGVNLVMASGNPVLHAETVAISLAGEALSTAGGVTLFASCEPCIMCLGASHWAGIGRIVWAAMRADAEAIGFAEGAGCDQLRREMAGRGVIFTPGLMREEGVTALRLYADAGGRIYGPTGSGLRR